MRDSGTQYPYVVILKNQNLRSINYSGFFLSLISCILFTRELFTGRIHAVFAVGVAFILGVLIYNFFRIRQGKKIYYSKALLIASLIWLKMPYGQWLFVLFVVLGLLERQAKSATEIGFDVNEIVFNSLFKKRISWKELTNVILKDNLLTMDFKNNRLVQREVDDEEEEDDATEEEFNSFCRSMLSRAES